jgi:hypothetical protein
MAMIIGQHFKQSSGACHQKSGYCLVGWIPGWGIFILH